MRHPWQSRKLQAMGSKAELGKPLILGESGSAAILWLHGFGDSPGGWATALQPFRTSIDANWRWVHLCAPLLPQPCFANRKLRAWGQFKTQETIRVGSVDYTDRDEARAYAASVEAVLSELQDLEKTISSDRLLIGGFSQGAAIALECALRYPRPLAGCVVLSGWARPPVVELLSQANSESRPITTPFLLCHGESDDMVDIGCAEAAAEILQNAKAQVQFQKYPGLKHEPCPDLLNLVADFVCRNLKQPLPNAIDWDAGSDSDSEEAMIYVSKSKLEALANSDASQEISKSSIEQLLDPSDLADSEVLVPARVQPGLLEITPAEAIKAIAESVEGLRQQMSGSPVLREITAEEWRRLQKESDGELAEEEELSNDETEDEDGSSDEDGGEPQPLESQPEEPPQKRLRTENASST